MLKNVVQAEPGGGLRRREDVAEADVDDPQRDDRDEDVTGDDHGVSLQWSSDASNTSNANLATLDCLAVLASAA
jgi:hypothetical protein